MSHHSLSVPAGHGRTFQVRKGQRIIIIDSEGSRPLTSLR